MPPLMTRSPLESIPSLPIAQAKMDPPLMVSVFAEFSASSYESTLTVPPSMVIVPLLSLPSEPSSPVALMSMVPPSTLMLPSTFMPLALLSSLPRL